MSRPARRPSPASVRSERLPAFERACATRRLANGMLAVHVPDPDTDAFTVGVTVRCGTRVETARESGVSHFLEHVLFRGSENHPTHAGLASEFEWLGGDWNAATGHESTEYSYAGIRATATEAVELFAEFLERPRLGDVDVERAVILREIDGETNEYGHSTDPDLHALSELWPDTGLARPILGTPDSLARLDRAALSAWRDRHYVPANLAVWAAGGEAGDGTLDLLERTFGDHRAAFAGAPATAHPPLPPARGGRVRQVEDGDNEYEVLLAFPCDGDAAEDAPVRRVLARILSDGFASRLPRRLREELGLVYDVTAGTAHLSDAGTFDVHASVRLEQFDTFFGELYAELRGLAERGPDGDETARAVLRASVDLDLTPTDPEPAASRLAWDGLRGRETSWVADRDRLSAIGPADVRRVARDLFRHDRAALIVLGPEDAGLEERLRRGLARGLPAPRG